MRLPRIPQLSDRFLKPFFCVTVVAQLLDLVSTMILVYGFGLLETNPVMSFALSVHPLFFAFLKLLTLPIMYFCLWKLRSYKLAQYGIILVLLPYLYVLLRHFHGIILLIKTSSL